MESHTIYPNAHITSMRPKNTVTNGGSTEILIQPYFFTLIDYTIGLVPLSGSDVCLYPGYPVN
jgi:hypothetical protein